MTHDDELIERVKDNIRDQALLVDTEVHDIALAAITVVRAYDAERRASVLDVDALKTFDPKTPGTLVWLPDGLTDAASLTYTSAPVQEIIHPAATEYVLMSSVQGHDCWTPDPTAGCYDPDDYRDLPLSMEGPVRFKGGLTEGK